MIYCLNKKMGTSLWTGICLFCSVLLISAYGQTCPYKECSCGQTVIMCNGLGLTKMPQLIISTNNYFTTAYYDSNNITTVTAGSIPPNLSQITFQVTPLTTIEDDAFVGSADTLTSLWFSNANFVKLPNALLRLNKLLDFHVTESTVQDWNDDVMKHIGSSVSSIMIENIHLGKWPSWMNYFTNLTELSIAGCQIPSIPDDAFVRIVDILTDLSLDNNSLTTVPQAIANFTNLQLLELDKNKITDARWLPQKSKLRSLQLQSNKLHDSDQLSTVLRPYADTLSDFNLHGNQLSSFPNIDYLTHVSTMDLRSNKLADPNAGSLPPALDELKLDKNAFSRIPRILTNLKGITQLYMASNAITQLEGTSFPINTRGCELQNNLLTQITDTSFPFNASITYILLNSNPISKVSDHAFDNLPHLVEIQMQFTKITRLPLALRVLTKIDVIDVRNTTSLVCTCLEKDLKEWILALPEYKVKGTCGKTSIYYFYHELSTGCP